MQDIVSLVVEFVHAHRAWAPVLVFLLAFAETLAFVSLLFPTTAILVALGGLVAAGALDFTPLWASAAAGAAAVATASFALGARYGARIFDLWPLRRDPTLALRSRAAFDRWGWGAVAVGHFVGPVRSVVFLAAGAAAMPALAFQFVNLPTSILWAFVIPKSGELGGTALGAIWRAAGFGN